MEKDAQESWLPYLHKHESQLISCKGSGTVGKMYRLLPEPIPERPWAPPVGQPIPGCSADNLLQRWVQTAGKWTIPYFKWNFVPCDPFSENSCVDFHFSEGSGWKSRQRKRNSPGSKMCCIFIAGLFVSSPPCAMFCDLPKDLWDWCCSLHEGALNGKRSSRGRMSPAG